MKPDYIFETSWEICNKIGGIYTVISTKAKSIVKEHGDSYIVIGPDVWKETTPNPDFLEDESLFADWKASALEEGLKVRTGRWNIEGKPLVFLVDFTTLYAKKDEIFAHCWETYKLDSLHGAWDYVEPALFGYNAGQVIKSFSDFYVDPAKKVVAHFHEWMSGAGVLFLNNKMPEAATVFTTHATVLGRTIAGNGLPLYSRLEEYVPAFTARDFNVLSKHSLEATAAHAADAFTTVSGITARECRHFLGRDPEVITPNGFEPDFVPKKEDFDKKRKTARAKAFETATAITGKKYADDTLLVITSGRYEFRNKGIDLFIKSLGKLNRSKSLKREILAYITIPTDHRGPTNVFRGKPKRSNYLTHKLSNWDYDAIIREIENQGLTNNPDSKVHVIFVPAYLNGNDGVINLSYYDFLIGQDLSVFPSYYEPWGYTPLESVAFKVPTITTTVAGFGDWVLSGPKLKTLAVSVIKRKEDNDDEVVDSISRIANKLIGIANTAEIRKETQEVFKRAVWEEFVEKYFDSWAIALKKAGKRKPEELYIPKVETLHVEAVIKQDRPEWRKVLVDSPLLHSKHPIKELAFNLWWSWNKEAVELFKSIAGDKWYDYCYNPVKLLNSLTADDISRMTADTEFMKKVKKVTTLFKEYMEESKNKPEELIAYFSMEYGLHSSVQIYSGGLGVLAGDYLKQASDSNKNLVGIGLLYRYGYFKQSLSPNGDQIAEYKAQKFTQLPLLPVRDEKGEWVKIKIALPGRQVMAKVWMINVGRIPLYLLDTDIKENSEEDRLLTSQLYGGDNEHRLKQEILLGIGGVRLINQLGLNPKVYHLNEGHSAFSSLERIRVLMEREGLDFSAAAEVVRSSSLFTTHTPVPAGHDTFEEHLMRAYLSHFSDYFKTGWDHFMDLGRYTPGNTHEKFSMSVLANKLSQEVNGVSEIHGRVSREMFRSLYPGYFPEELNIGHVTNGVHYHTWTADIWQDLYRDTFPEGFENDQPNEKFWENIYDVSDEMVWKNRMTLKKKLIKELKVKQKRDLTHRHENPKLMIQSMAALDKKTLTIGFARRFATYKRAHLLFTNMERLSQIVNNEEKPVIFLFAGKAHPNDKAGQDLIKRIIEISRMPDFVGKILFLENYDMTLGKLLTSSVDIWLNTPTRPLEASGTSGEKAVMNGVMNFSVLDGWWAEGYQPETGWAIEESRTFNNQEFQNELDAEIIYSTLEDEIVPMYYDTDNEGIPHEWVSRIKNTIARIAPHFTMQRMLNDYYNQFYSKLFKTGAFMRSESYEHARELVHWKNKVKAAWDAISVESLAVPDVNKGPVEYGKNFTAELVLNIPGLEPGDIGVEILMGNKANGDVKHIDFKQELDLVEKSDGKAKFSCTFPLTTTGVMDYAFRIYPKHPYLQYRMDFPLVKWV